MPVISGQDRNEVNRTVLTDEAGRIVQSTESLEEVFNKILKELKKINLHLSLINDNEIKNTEVE
jgi:hypothetical protein